MREKVFLTHTLSPRRVTHCQSNRTIFVLTRKTLLLLLLSFSESLILLADGSVVDRCFRFFLKEGLLNVVSSWNGSCRGGGRGAWKSSLSWEVISSLLIGTGIMEMHMVMRQTEETVCQSILSELCVTRVKILACPFLGKRWNATLKLGQKDDHGGDTKV